jgi:hypothetical protein
MARPRKYKPDDMMVLACRLAIEASGGHKKLAQQIGLTAQAIYVWEVVPEWHLTEVARISGISAHVLRPDLDALKPEHRRLSA